MGHGHSSNKTEVQGKRSRLGFQFKMRSGGPWSSIEDSFLVYNTYFLFNAIQHTLNRRIIYLRKHQIQNDIENALQSDLTFCENSTMT